MTKKYFSLFLAGGLCLFVVQQAFTNSGGAPAGSSGSPASNSNTCSQSGCHSGPAVSTQSVSISTDIPGGGFVEDSTYEITVTGDHGGTVSSRIGFMASVEDPSGHVGTLRVIDANRTQKAGNYITHRFNGLGVSNNENSWTFDWDSEQAPDQSTVYAAVNFTNNNGNTLGDVVVTQSLVLSKDNSVGLSNAKFHPVSLYPNPAQDYLVVASPKPLAMPLQIFNLEGKLIKSFGSETRQDGQHWRLPLQEITRGSYLLKDAEGKGAIFQKN